MSFLSRIIGPARWPSVCRFAAALCVLILSLVASDGSTFIRAGAVWLYLDNGTDQGTAWRELEFEDDGWSSGPAQLGYGDGDEVTEVGYGPDPLNRYLTTYFRHKFTVLDRTAVTNLVLRLLRDDGAVVYLNGVEVFRSNMPAGPVNYLTEAVSSISGSGEDTFITANINAALLQNGPNVLAVEIHQEEGDSSDVSFDLELTDGNSDSPVVDIVSPANSSVFAMPGDIAINVSATDPNGAITNVQIFSGNVLVQEKTSAPFHFIWTNVAPGAHEITARAYDNDGQVTLSDAVRFVVGSGGVSNLVLLPAGAVWKYLDNGSDQGTAWRGTNFDDSAWSSGQARLGYGDSQTVTTVGYGGVSTNKYATTYFRRAFVVEDLGAVSALVMRLLRDDGAIVYLNGVEVYRSNMPTGAVTYTTFASQNLSAPDEDSFIRTVLNPSALVSGTNTLAVEIHQANRTSSDMGFNLELTGSDYPALLRGPWLQAATPTSIIVKWRTDASVRGRVRYGLSPTNLSSSSTESTATAEHRIELTGLSPNTRYYYSIGTTNSPLIFGDEYYFVTPPTPGTRKKTRFWALGDAGTANVDQYNVRDAFYRTLDTNTLDMILMLGDNAYNAGTDSEYQRAVFDVYPTVLRNTVLWSTIGNHETDQSTSPSSSIPYYQIFSLPRDGEAGGVASGTEDYYSFDYANIHFICLDSMTSSRATNGAMATWLRADLEATAQEWIIAFWHHPPYTKGSHNSDTESELIQMRENILPILEAYGVDLVLSGHSHAYERSHLLNGHYGRSSTLTSAMKKDAGGGRVDGAGAYLKPSGVVSNQGAVYVVTGSAGKVSGGGLNHPAMFLSLNRLGSLVVEVDGGRMDAFFIRENGLTNDSFTIIKGPAITVADTSINEPGSNSFNAAFTLRLSETSSAPVSVSYVTSPETAATGLDFLAADGSITFPPGVTTQTVLVPILGDALVETNETFSLQLFGSPLLSRSFARGTILDEDSQPPTPPMATVILTSGGGITLSWQSEAGRTYRILFKDNLAEPEWQQMPDVIVGNGEIITLMTNTGSSPQRFYRVAVQ